MSLHRLVIIGLEDHLVSDKQRVIIGSLMDIAGDDIKFFSSDTDVKHIVKETFNVESGKVYFGEKSEILLTDSTPQSQILKFRTLGKSVSNLVIKEGIQSVESLDGMTDELIARWLKGDKITSEEFAESKRILDEASNYDDDDGGDDVSQIFALLDESPDDYEPEKHESNEVILGPSDELTDNIESFVPDEKTVIPDQILNDDDLGFVQMPDSERPELEIDSEDAEDKELNRMLDDMNPDKKVVPAPAMDDTDSDDGISENPLDFLIDDDEDDEEVSVGSAPLDDNTRDVDEPPRFEPEPEPEPMFEPEPEPEPRFEPEPESDDSEDDAGEIGFEPAIAGEVGDDEVDNRISRGQQDERLNNVNQEDLFGSEPSMTAAESNLESGGGLEAEEDEQGYISIPVAEDALSVERAYKQREYIRNKELYGDALSPTNRIGSKGRIILVSSAKGGQSKSTVAWAMWAGLTQARIQSGETDKQTWLIETDYNSPLLKYVMPDIRDGQDLGGLARMIMRARESTHTELTNGDLLQAIIREFSYVDERTGGRVIVAPVGRSNIPEKYFKIAIVEAVRAISESGDAIILDGGIFDIRSSQDVEISLAYRIAHHTVIATTPAAAGPSRQLARTLTSQNDAVPFSPLAKSNVRVILSQATRDKADSLINDFFPPINVDAVIPQIPDLLPGNCEVTENGVSHISLEAPAVQEAVIIRASRVLVACGYTDYEKYFTPNAIGATGRSESNRKKTFGERIGELFSRGG